jgi:carboxyl-terminal processing protease
MKRREVALALAGLSFSPWALAQAPAFDAAAAWDAFAALVRQSYAYNQRPGIDGEAILARFAPRARACTSDAAFIDVLQLVARNFADPHFVVGPFDGDDYTVIPSGSDVHAEMLGDAFVVIAVRAGSAAVAAGIKPGAQVVEIDGRTPQDAIAHVLGIAFAEATPPQITYALNTALAGRWGKPRALRLIEAGAARTVALAPGRDQARVIQKLDKVSLMRRGVHAILTINNSLGDNATIPAFRAALAQAQDARGLLIDLRNTPSGGNTTVARAIMGHFTRRERPYKTHVIPYEARVFGAPRKFTEFVLPAEPFFPGRVFVAGGRWTGSMGEGMMIGFDAMGVPTLGSKLGHLLGGINNLTLKGSAARIDLATEALYHVDGRPREAFKPRRYLAMAEAGADGDPVLKALGWA